MMHMAVGQILDEIKRLRSDVAFHLVFDVMWAHAIQAEFADTRRPEIAEAVSKELKRNDHMTVIQYRPQGCMSAKDAGDAGGRYATRWPESMLRKQAPRTRRR